MRAGQPGAKAVEMIILVMSHDELQSLIAGYALGILDDEEKRLLEEHLPTCAICRADLASLQGVADDLAWSVEPAPLPQGHLARLRTKAQVAPAEPAPAPPQTSPVPRIITPDEFQQARERRNRRGTWGGLSTGWRVAYAASLLLFVAAAVFGYLFVDANNRLNQQEANQRALATLLASPNLKVTELQPTGTGQKSSARLLADTTTNQAVIVSQDLATLPQDKAYEVWLIGADGKPKSAGVITRDNQNAPVVAVLSAPGAVDQYKVVAITVEDRKGSPTGGPTTNPFTAGNIA
jgi:anti-sigma-K factor RskA